jgi:hypothetical protein
MGKSEGAHWEDLDISEIILKWFFKKQSGSV